MGKKMLAVAGVAMAVAGLAPTTAAEAAAPNCQFQNSYGVVVDEGFVRAPADTGTIIGKIQLCRDSSRRYWAFLLLNNSPNASTYGDAEILRYLDGNFQTFVSCASTGGNGVVISGQRRCWTPRFSGVNTRYTFFASGATWSSHTGNRISGGHTDLTR